MKPELSCLLICLWKVTMPIESILLLGLALLLSVGLGVRWYRMRRDREIIARRLSAIINPEPTPESHLDPVQPWSPNTQVDDLIAQSGFKFHSWDLWATSVLIIVTGAVAGLLLSAQWWWGAGAGALLATCPWIVINVRANQRRAKFNEQLPNALDLFISVLRSGHSIPQAVRAVADEVPAPCGSEFAEMLQRMNLGQTLPQALAYSVSRFKSFELDLIRRATEIQMEIGGSLSDLLEKTNQTLRQRLKLQKQVQVLTAPSRLSAVIIFILPFLIAITFSFINPDYMAPLTDTKLGRALLSLAIAAQLVGYLIMRKLASFKV